jgi:hypothetical protein
MNGEVMTLFEREVLAWPGVSKERAEGGPGRGGFWVPPFVSYRFGRKELGHVHDTGMADLTFPKEVHDELVAAGRAASHGAGFAGVVSYHIRTEEDVPGAVALFRLNYDRIRASAERRRKG